jgi:hypothetical protein
MDKNVRGEGGGVAMSADRLESGEREREGERERGERV